MQSEAIFDIRPEEYDQVVEVWEASVRATHHFINETDIQYFKPLIREQYLYGVTLASTRDDEGGITGFLGINGEEISMLFIHPDWRGKGLGRRLVEHAIRYYGAIKVDVNEQNEQALGFYQKMGFEVIGRSELDDTGRPYPLLHMRLEGSR